MITYFKNVAKEMKRVTWPTQEQASRETVTVIAVSIIFAAFLGGADWLLQNGFGWLLAH
ncbi:preprotein translocase subunit SecE [Leuconostoc fallax]|uniref:Protein translocase subunit SecE n=1 Tax=Leuconostoc fallax TaxID=1251 RepID=A0A4R5NA43_9LACO|nr:preprotein translocase subunit SecE [Leuconostoc fallax]MBU7456280.1 preprotein translocase subunit SecE [Leuconostoc fallax]MCO6184567.1 preprotein translocase subunit SecE [Leuconostoc fallax]TDG69105.1 hypothetical protein C5L23_001236 [Leuconostoc fallax]